MALTAAEQYMLELINRARLDPLAEAARLGIDLNEGLSPGYLGTHARQVFAHNDLLETAAIGHSQWMLSTDIFSHTGAGGSTPYQRTTAAGYVSTTAGENISWSGSTGPINLNTLIAEQHDSLFLSAGHRINLLNGNNREIGIAQEQGVFTSGGYNYNTSMVTQNFSRSGTNFFVTGVAYTDSNGDGFYSIGEARAGVTFTTSLGTTTTATAGGYSLLMTPGSAVSVTGTVGATAFAVTLNTGNANAKLDIVNGTTLQTSADITLVSGLRHVELLGVGDLDATGNTAANRIEGNKGANLLKGGSGVDTVLGGEGNDSILGEAGNDQTFGEAGADTLRGGGGNDLVDGGAGNDSLFGDAGHDNLIGGLGDDTLTGGAGNDVLQGGDGNDRLSGDGGADTYTGGAGADVFVFGRLNGNDRVTDLQAGDVLQIDDAIWGSTAKTAAQVVADYGQIVNGEAVLQFTLSHKVTLTGITTLDGLDAHITIV